MSATLEHVIDDTATDAHKRANHSSFYQPIF